jgi:hypothetical protein
MYLGGKHHFVTKVSHYSLHLPGMLMGRVGTQVLAKRIPPRLVGMAMWIWMWYQGGMILHTFVPYWGVLRLYLRPMWIMGIHL